MKISPVIPCESMPLTHSLTQKPFPCLKLSSNIFAFFRNHHILDKDEMYAVPEQDGSTYMYRLSPGPL